MNAHLEHFNPAICISAKIMRINRITGNIIRKYIQTFWVINSQVSILFVISKRRALTQKELAAFTKLEKSSIHRNLKRLIDQAYLSRTDFPLIKITEKGLALVNDIVPEWEKAMTDIRALLADDGEQALNLIHSKLHVQ